MNTIITVDVEAHRGNNPIETFIWGRAIDGKKYGLELIVETLNKYGLRGLFFVDFAEIVDYGEESIAEVINYLKTQKQDIGIHLHPDHFGDKSRTFLWQYSYEEQCAMVEFCVKKFDKLVGIHPLYFRAGKFGANDDTLKALCKYNIKYDSSCFYNHCWCKITNQYPSNCAYYIMNDLIEMPVSVFKSISINGKTIRIDQFDLSNHPLEMKHAIEEQQILEDKSVLTLFFHSFSFFPYRNNPERVRFNKRVYRRFIGNLKYIKENNINNIADFDNPNINVFNYDCHSEIKQLPSSGPLIGQVFFLIDRAWFIFPSNRKAKMLLLSIVLVASIFIILILIFTIM